MWQGGKPQTTKSSMIMWSAAVDRQPGHRGRNLHRRSHCMVWHGLTDLNIEKIFQTIQKITRKKNVKKNENINPDCTSHIIHSRTRDQVQTTRKSYFPREFKRWHMLLQENSRKTTFCDRKLLFCMTLVETKHTLRVYVERRGKPSTWLPRQKLAEVDQNRQRHH